MLDCRLARGDLPRGIHKRTGIAARKRHLIPHRICRAVDCRKTGLLGAITINEKPPRHRGKIIAKPAFRPVYAAFAQHLGQADEDLLNSFLDICRGEPLIDGADEMPQGRRVQFDELKPNRRIVALREIGDFP